MLKLLYNSVILRFILSLSSSVSGISALLGLTTISLMQQEVAGEKNWAWWFDPWPSYNFRYTLLVSEVCCTKKLKQAYIGIINWTIFVAKNYRPVKLS